MGTETVPTCQHQMEEGRACECPALRRLRYCYFHQREHACAARKMTERARQRWFDSVALHDSHAIQRALRETIQRLASGQVDHKKAGQMLYKLQTAIMNLQPADAK